MRVEPNMIITIDPKWKNFEDYKDSLKSKYRIKVNKADSTSRSLDARLFSESDFATFKDELQQLYQNTIDNANFNAQVLNLDTYVKLRAAYHEDFIVKAYFYNDVLVGFLSALANNNHLDAHFIGLDYSLNKTLAIYPRILNDYIRIGIEKKVKYINLGRTASEIKTTVGAIPVELTCYLRHKRLFVNSVFKFLNNKIHLKEFKQHYPFKI
jgi:predicted N-acyltransferase